MLTNGRFGLEAIESIKSLAARFVSCMAAVANVWTNQICGNRTSAYFEAMACEQSWIPFGDGCWSHAGVYCNRLELLGGQWLMAAQQILVAGGDEP